VIRHGGVPSDIFIEEHSLRGLAVHFAKGWRKCDLLDVVGRWKVQWAGHE
jgi:hypothetical protein